MWLSDRKQCILINGYCSEWKDVCSGMPWGSILEQILFISFINDIDYIIIPK